MFKCIPVQGYVATVDMAKFTSGSAVGITLPKNFITTDVVVNVKTKDTGTSPTVTVSAGTETLVSAASVGTAGVAVTAVAKCMAADTDITVTVGGTPAKNGVVDVIVNGMACGVDEPYASAGTNAAPADPYTPPEKA